MIFQEWHHVENVRFIFTDCSWINESRIIQATNLSADFYKLCLNLASKYELVHGQGTYQFAGHFTTMR
jgi:hypothetical protein